MKININEIIDYYTEFIIRLRKLVREESFDMHYDSIHVILADTELLYSILGYDVLYFLIHTYYLGEEQIRDDIISIIEKACL